MATPFYVVYRTTNLKTGEFYIGCHKTRFVDDEYLGSGAEIRKAVRRQGKEEFEKKVLHSFEDRIRAEEKETELIGLSLNDPLCYNVRPRSSGGNTGGVMTPLPLPVRRVLERLGEDIRNARKRRRIPVAVLAERASLSRTTLTKIEKGDPGVGLGSVSVVLFSLGMIDRLERLVETRSDDVGLMLQDEALPKRVRLKPWERSEIAAQMSKL